MSKSTTSPTAGAITASVAKSPEKIDFSNNDNDMPPMTLFRHFAAVVTLGLLCGWYYFLMVLYPVLIYGVIRGSIVCIGILTMFIALTFAPLKYETWDAFIYGWVFDIWREYFDFQYDMTELHSSMKEGDQFMFCEFPHGIFPMGQMVSSSVIRDITPGKHICGTGASVIFNVPVMRQVMAWCGVRPVKKNTISKIVSEGHHLAIIPGGIAEMFLVNDTSERIYLKKRLNTMKVALTHGLNVVPVYFYGNSCVLRTLNQGTESWFSKMSRKLRASLVFFYGRWGLPVPFRRRIKMQIGTPIKTVQCANPTDAQAQELMDTLVAALEEMYEKKKPAWETRPLIVE